MRIARLLAAASLSFASLTAANAQSTDGGMGQGGMDHGRMGQGGMMGGRGGMGDQEMMKPAGEMADGEVRKVDKDAQKITVRHGPLPQLDMPMAMTMVYRVKDAAMLEQVKPGDKVKFQAEKIGGAFTITKIEPAR